MKNLRFNKDGNTTLADEIRQLAATKPEVIQQIVTNATKPKS